MVIEATLICLDNSDWTRNGDYFSTRWTAQIDAANFIIENRCESNPENSLGILTMAGKRVDVLCSLTNDESILLNSIKNTNISGECDIITALNIGYLCLKHRMNKNQKQRIILFVGSPIKSKPEEFITLGKKLKKYNIAIDIISFGNIEENKVCLTNLLNNINNSNNSSMLEIPIGQYIMDTILSSSIVGFGGDQMNMDVNDNPQGGNINQQGIGMSQFEKDMNLAMQLSLQESKAQNEKNKANESKTPKIDEELDEEKELEKARLLSLQESEKAERKEKEKEVKNEILNNQDFIEDILKEVGGEGKDAKDIMENIKGDKKDEKKEDKKDEKKDEKKEEKNDKKDDKMDIDDDKNK